MGYFDPWVTPLIAAVPPNEVAAFECPMHEGMRSIHEGTCPLCGMQFQPIRPHRPAGVPHDPGFDLRVSFQPAGTPGAETGGAGNPTSMLLEIRKDGAPMTDLTIVHEQPMHLVVVSEELAYFDHVHPTPAKDGAFEWRYTFPHVGHYVLFAELTPRGDRSQVFRVPFDVGEQSTRILETTAGERFDGADLHPDQAAAKLLQTVTAGQTPQDSAPLDPAAAHKEGDVVQVQLVTQPRTLVAGLHAQLLFRLADADGRPIVDLQPYLGALGHCMIISQDTADFVHSHPQQLSRVVDAKGGGPEIEFSALFPKPGRYRLWAQFKRPDTGAGPQMVIAPFDVEVKQPWIPASVLRFLLNE
jgi:hypothetical protein